MFDLVPFWYAHRSFKTYLSSVLTFLVPSPQNIRPVLVAFLSWPDLHFFLCTKEILSENPFLLLRLLISVIIWSQIGNCWSWMFDICFKCIGIHEKLFVFSGFPVPDVFRSFFFSFFSFLLSLFISLVLALSLLRTLQYLLSSCYPTQVIHCLTGQPLLLWPAWYVTVRIEEFGTWDHMLGAKFLSMLINSIKFQTGF